VARHLVNVRRLKESGEEAQFDEQNMKLGDMDTTSGDSVVEWKDILANQEVKNVVYVRELKRRSVNGELRT
jgi:hypothetical protein